jgi:ankyrin repeat protein
VVALLLDKARDTLDVNQARTDNRASPLSIACYFGHARVVTLLLAQDHIDVSLVTVISGQECTPLKLATMQGHMHIVKLIRDHQVNFMANSPPN